MKRMMQITAAALILLAAFAFCAPALAAPASGDAYTVIVCAASDDVQVLATTAYVQATANVNVRSGPGTGYSKLGELAKGQTVEKLGVSGNWTKISYNGKTAYVSTQYLKDVLPAETASASYVQATANVNVRSGPGTSYSKLGQLTKGQTVQKLGTSGSWTKISYNGKTAYVSSQYLKAVSSSSSGSATATAYVEATANVNVRSGPGTSYSKLGQLYKGTIVPKLGTSGSWTKIIYNSQTAYVSSQYLKSSSYTGDAGSSGSGGTSTSTGGTFNDAAAAELISIINGYRQNAGIAKLTTTAALNKAAKIRVQEIVKQFSHTRPDGTACFTVDPDNVQGENIAKGSGLPTAQSAADGFMNSTRHRENAMRTTFTKTGAACLKVGATTYWVHLFGY